MKERKKDRTLGRKKSKNEGYTGVAQY